MKVKMLLKSGFGAIRHGEVVDAAPDHVRLGLQLGFLAPAVDEAAPLRPGPPPPGTSARPPEILRRLLPRRQPPR